ncbi:MAG: conjugative transfer: assembly [uncultured bacterium]|nr:MAG: conjugative transfer: assembly [uncultured bacterium]
MKEMKKIFVLNAMNTKNRTFSHFILVLFSLSVLTGALSGCTSMNGKFDCNVGSGGKCAPMNHINQMANYGVFNDSQLQATKTNKMNKTHLTPMEAPTYVYRTPDGLPIRSGESIQKIWIGPYEDDAGNYHEPSYVYVVSKKGKWLGESASAIQD